MDSYINVIGNGQKTVKVFVQLAGVITKETLRAAFLLEEDVPISLFRNDIALHCDGSAFYLQNEWNGAEFEMTWEEARRSQPAAPIQAARPISPYPEVPMPPAPTAKSIDKWMYFLLDSVGKSCVICIHPRFFVTFRHGSHLQLKVGDEFMVYKVKGEGEEQVGINVCVAKIDESLDFILLKSGTNVAENGPPLSVAEESEPFTLAGLGNEHQTLSYLPGTIRSVRGYYSHFQGNLNLMGPFILGTSPSSAGDSGGGCWGAYGLIGMNVACTLMPSTYHHSAISEAAVFSSKNVISPSAEFKKAYLVELEKERKVAEKTSPPRKKPCNMIEFEGIGIGYGSFD